MPKAIFGAPLLLTAVFLSFILFIVNGCGGARTQLSRDLEQARVTSPAGAWDAVLIREDGGGAGGGWEYYVYIVQKGNPVNTDESPVFNAGTLTDGALTWSRPNLLDIRYRIADINQFTNYWDSSRLRSNREERDDDFKVEIRLVPSSSDYSLLSPNGTFKSSQ